MKVPSSSDVLLLPMAAMLAAVTWLLVVYGALVRHSGTVAAALFAILLSVIAVAAFQRLRALKQEHDAFLARLDGRPIEEALAAAKAEARGLPPGLVAAKVSIPFERWHAFERGAFQFVLARDERGNTRAFTI